jgi:uncharacterized membrane protein YqaE (UPF0057 family)
MRKLMLFMAGIVGILVLDSCSTSNNVVGGAVFQKRKYTGGVYWDRSEKVKKGKEEEYDISKIDEESQRKYVTSTSIHNEFEMFEEGDAVTIEAVSSVDDKAIDVSDNDADQNVNKANVQKNLVSSISIVKENVKKEAVKLTKKNSSSPAGDVATILLVILAILIPPLAVFLFEGVTSRFWIDLILAIIGWGVGFYLLGGLGWICGIASIIYALLIVLNVI